MRFLIPRACGGCVEFEPTHGGHGVRTYGGVMSVTVEEVV